MAGTGAGLPADERFNASEQCWLSYCELSVYTLGRSYESFIHQQVVDAYAAEHAVDRFSNIGIVFALIGLYLAVEKGLSGRDVQRAHMRLGRLRKTWPRFERPNRRAAMNVGDVMRAAPGEKRDAEILRWAGTVWHVWQDQQEWIRRTCADMLGISEANAASDQADS